MKTKKKTYVIDAFTIHQIKNGKASMSEAARVIGCTPQTISNHVKTKASGKAKPATKAAAKTTAKKPAARTRGNVKWREASGVIEKCLKKGMTMASAAEKAGVSISYAYAIKKMNEQACA